MFNIAYPQIERNADAVWSFLLHGGYLKADERQQLHTFITYRLAIPNLEVKVVYEKVVRDWLEEDVEISDSFQSFIRGIREGDTGLIEEGLGDILFGLASYHDTASRGRREERKRTEGFYHGLVLGMLAYLGGEYMVESNRECGMGRPDIVLIRRDTGSGRPARVLLFEFKREDAGGTTPLEQLAGEAYCQAEQKYLEGLRKKWEPEEILVLGVGFRGRELALEGGGELPGVES